MRLVLVDHGGERVRGDSAVFAARSPEWAENTFLNKGVAQLAIVAARVFDESEGRFRWNYHYSPFGPFEKCQGYDVFACAQDLDDAPACRYLQLSNVICECFYVGHVRCIPPVVSLHSRRMRAAAGSTHWPAEGPVRRKRGGR